MKFHSICVLIFTEIVRYSDYKNR
uniref:Uncharacterized protein n=1 Tax=Arundo donax TaxID=35708 RepID=A0A0A9BEX2_ARUDO